MAENFNVEEFLEFGSENLVEQLQQDSLNEQSQSWPEYPDLFPKESPEMKEDPISLISFEGASLIKEEYVDPFAALSSKCETKAGDFLIKLQLRRQKLEQMAQSLRAKNSLESWDLIEDSLASSIDCENRILPWKNGRRSVQVYSIHNVILDKPDEQLRSDIEKSNTIEELLSFFEFNLPQYLQSRSL